MWFAQKRNSRESPNVVCPKEEFWIFQCGFSKRGILEDFQCYLPTRENLEESILEIDDALRQELEKSLQSLGNQLATLSQKFVDDYGELTTKMKTVIHIAES